MAPRTGVRDAKRAPKALWVCPICGERRMLLVESPAAMWQGVPCRSCGNQMKMAGVIMVRSLDRTKLVCLACGTVAQFQPGVVLCPRCIQGAGP